MATKAGTGSFMAQVAALMCFSHFQRHQNEVGMKPQLFT
jgi:hypothetical protein